MYCTFLGVKVLFYQCGHSLHHLQFKPTFINLVNINYRGTGFFYNTEFGPLGGGGGGAKCLV